MKFRKKPVVIEATQWFKNGDHPAVVNMGVPLIMTLEGPLYVTPGDWIIKGVKGEFYPCKPDIFAATYEPVSDDAPAAPQAEPKEENNVWKQIIPDDAPQADAQPAAWRVECRWTDRSKGGDWRKYADYGTEAAARSSQQVFANPGNIESRIVPLYTHPAPQPQAGPTPEQEAALQRMADNARELGLDYEPMPQPERQPLTNEQIDEIGEPFGYFTYGDAQGDKRRAFVRAIESSHGIGYSKAIEGGPSELRSCTCHPDDNPPAPCAQQYALNECRAAQPERQPVSEPTEAQTEASQAARDVLAERRRQVEAEGWTPAHDDKHIGGQMAMAAACYAAHAAVDECIHCTSEDTLPSLAVLLARAQGFVAQCWPWSHRWWKPSDRRRNLVKAGALILAEIERLDRAALAAKR